MIQTAGKDWEECNTQVFWKDIAAHDHLVQIYENDHTFLNLLSGYITGGILSGDSVVVIATAAHLKALELRLKANNFDLFALTWRDQYIPLDADETLGRFMVSGWPDEKLFMEVVPGVMARAKKKNRKVRAFGEMVAILMAQEQFGPTIALERLWNKYMETEKFCLFCAYPRSAFNQNPTLLMTHVCGTHSKIITAGNSTSDVKYRNILAAKN